MDVLADASQPALQGQGRGVGKAEMLFAAFYGMTISTKVNFKMLNMQLGGDASDSLSVAKNIRNYSMFSLYLLKNLFLLILVHKSHQFSRSNFWLHKIMKTDIYRVISVFQGLCK